MTAPLRFRQTRGTTRASARRALQRLRSDIDSGTSDVVNPAGSPGGGGSAGGASYFAKFYNSVGQFIPLGSGPVNLIGDIFGFGDSSWWNGTDTLTVPVGGVYLIVANITGHARSAVLTAGPVFTIEPIITGVTLPTNAVAYYEAWTTGTPSTQTFSLGVSTVSQLVTGSTLQLRITNGLNVDSDILSGELSLIRIA